MRSDLYPSSIVAQQVEKICCCGLDCLDHWTGIHSAKNRHGYAAWETGISLHSLVHFSVGMRLLVVLVIAVAADALHFYLDANQKRCFIEELPTDTVVEGMLIPSDQLFRNLIVRT